MRTTAPAPRRILLDPARFALLRATAPAVRLPPPFDGLPDPGRLDPRVRETAEADLREAGVLDDHDRGHPGVAASLLCHDAPDATVHLEVRRDGRVHVVRAATSGLLASLLEITFEVGDDPEHATWASPATLTTAAVDHLVDLLSSAIEPAPTAAGRAPRSLTPAEGARALAGTLTLRIASPPRDDVRSLTWVLAHDAWWEPLARPEADGVHVDLAPVDAGILADRLTAALTRRLEAGVARG